MAARGFTAYATAVTGAGFAALVLCAVLSPSLPLDDWRLWLLAVLVMVGERLPIEVPRSEGHDRVVLSAMFAFAALLLLGPLPAVLMYGAACLVEEVRDRVGPAKAAFNTAQYVLSIAAAAAVLGLLGHPAPIADLSASLPAVFAAAATCFVVNHVLAGVGVALLAGRPVVRSLVDDIAFQAGTAGFLLALSPIVAATAMVSAALVPLMLLPAVAIYFGSRNASLHAHRATHDTLTGLPNRLALQERLTSALALSRREARPVSLLLLDLDDFKAVNDTLGHAFGDDLLQAVCERLQQRPGPTTSSPASAATSSPCSPATAARSRPASSRSVSPARSTGRSRSTA
jgi:diguanylate cyclase